MKINLNDEVKVKLTEVGVQRLAELHYELNEDVKRRNGKGLGHFVLRLDQDGYYKTQLWALCDKFSPFMKLGSESAFKDNEIIIKDEFKSRI